jgi:hypothetical protein
LRVPAGLLVRVRLWGLMFESDIAHQREQLKYLRDFGDQEGAEYAYERGYLDALLYAQSTWRLSGDDCGIG